MKKGPSPICRRNHLASGNLRAISVQLRCKRGDYTVRFRRSQSGDSGTGQVMRVLFDQGIPCTNSPVATRTYRQDSKNGRMEYLGQEG